MARRTKITNVITLVAINTFVVKGIFLNVLHPAECNMKLKREEDQKVLKVFLVNVRPYPAEKQSTQRLLSLAKVGQT